MNADFISIPYKCGRTQGKMCLHFVARSVKPGREASSGPRETQSNNPNKL